MPTTPPATRPTGSGAFARTTITLVMAAIAALAFAFSFGNVWALALRLGVSRPVAPLIAPMVDLSVVGLLVALHHLAATGIDPAQLRQAIRLMHLCGLLTLALNTTEPVLAGHYGRAGLDAVAPCLLLGWGIVSPGLLRLLHANPEAPAPPVGVQPLNSSAVQNLNDADPAGPMPTGVDAPPPQPPKPSPEVATRQTGPVDAVLAGNREPASPGRRGRPPAATMDQLIAIARPAVAESGATLSVVKNAVRASGTPISNDRLGELLQLLKDEQAAGQPEPVIAHSGVG
ncbi:DUF2637 domain-containing protein [Kitasatospora sp. NPDC047058]|uniref:DUF2637 domain-containing protein n=1 Tax=Kitasatospora sp. NPDC047058 TaxID=3155620 RepID=UPI0033DFC43F